MIIFLPASNALTYWMKDLEDLSLVSSASFFVPLKSNGSWQKTVFHTD
jgi:hypothetical protein